MKQKSILIVEDERIVALDFRQRLEDLGYAVRAVVATGRQAIEKAEALQPDLVLMDIHLEGSMDGIEAARKIYEAYRIPVVFLTAFSGDETLERAQQTLPFGYLTKPCDIRELHATIQMALARHAAETALKTSEERLRIALEAGQMEVWEWDAATGQTSSSGPMGGIFGGVSRPISELWETFLERVHVEDRAAVQLARKRSMSTGEPLNLVFRTFKEDGTVMWHELHAKLNRASPNGLARLVGVIKDVTERRLMEEQLRRAGVVFETTAEAIFIMDAERRIVSVNPAFTAITGYTAEEALGRDADALLHARRHSDQFYSQLESVAGRVWQGETSCQRKSGEIFPAWESVSIVSDARKGATHYVTAFSDISAIRRAEEQIHHLAYHDALTGLPNRLLFKDRLDNILELVHRQQRRCALLFLDLDGFKVINDTLGHANGDLLLQTVATRITSSLRRSDTAARLGGDEFVIIMPDVTKTQDAARLARKLLELLTAPIDLVGERISISGSIGISVYPEDGTDRHALLKAADTAMYHAKGQGRNRFCFYTPAMSVRAAERLSVEQGLRHALEAGGLVLHYQPFVALGDGAVTGVEALVRWDHPREGLMSPGRFIPVAEESGLIEPLGRWVLFTACKDAVKWLSVTDKPIRLSVNVSARQFVREGFDEIVRDALRESGLPASSLELEITESTLHAAEHTLSLLKSLKEIGVSIAIDDFGTGYSSLSMLRQLPIDCLEIDRSFVRDITDAPNDIAIVEAISAMSRALGLRTTAEGVENEVQRQTLARLGCHEAQGFLFGKPVPVTQVRSLIC